jgi:hypothetical protein
MLLLPALSVALVACGGSSKKHASPAFGHVQSAEIAMLHAHPSHKHHLRVSCTATACTADLRLRDRVHTIAATDTWAVNGARATLQGPSAIGRFLVADAGLGCTSRFFAVIKAAHHPAPGLGPEKAALVRALAPCQR